MAHVRYRVRRGGTDWQPFVDPTVNAYLWAAIWGWDFEVAIEDGDDPTRLIVLTSEPTAVIASKMARTPRRKR